MDQISQIDVHTGENEEDRDSFLRSSMGARLPDREKIDMLYLPSSDRGGLDLSGQQHESSFSKNGAHKHIEFDSVVKYN